MQQVTANSEHGGSTPTDTARSAVIYSAAAGDSGAEEELN